MTYFYTSQYWFHNLHFIFYIFEIWPRYNTFLSTQMVYRKVKQKFSSSLPVGAMNRNARILIPYGLILCIFYKFFRFQRMKYDQKSRNLLQHVQNPKCSHNGTITKHSFMKYVSCALKMLKFHLILRMSSE